MAAPRPKKASAPPPIRFADADAEALHDALKLALTPPAAAALAA